MPNHTSQLLIVTGENGQLGDLLEVVKSTEINKDTGKSYGFCLQSVVPMPEGLHNVSSPVKVVSEADYKKSLTEEKPFPGMGGPITKKMQKEYLKKYGADNWYDWAIKHWGTKWDVYKIGEWQKEENKAAITFQSAWSPVNKVIQVLSERFPKLTFTLKFADEGGGFLGYETFSEGQLADQADVEWDSKDGIELREELGCYYPEEESEVTKYDENTGAPYKKTLSDPVHILGTKKFTEDEWADFLEEYDYKPGELELVTIAERPHDVLGVKIAGTESHRSGKEQLVEVTQTMIDAAVAKAKQELAKFGIKEVKLFIVPHFSY